MATADVEVSRDWASQRAKRTQAMPAKSLFGSSLEMQDEKQLKEMKDIDLKQYEEGQSQTTKRRERNRPVHFEDGLPGKCLLKGVAISYLEGKKDLATSKHFYFLFMIS